jgi:hypothetical protein
MRIDIASIVRVLGEHTLRLESIEAAVASLKLDHAQYYNEIALIKTLYNSSRERIDRVERRVYRTKNLPPKLTEAIKNSKMDPAHDHLNALLEEEPDK